MTVQDIPKQSLFFYPILWEKGEYGKRTGRQRANYDYDFR